MGVEMNNIEKNGYCVIDNFCHFELTLFARSFGEIRSDPRSPELIREIRPQEFDNAKPNTLSSRYGLSSFPFHTDAAHWEEPARFLMFYCVNPGEGNRPTYLQDSREWQLDEHELDLASRALWAISSRNPKLSTMARIVDENLHIKYDADCMRPMSKLTRELHDLIKKKISTSNRVYVNWNAGDLLVIDNARMLHSRGQSLVADPSRLHMRILVGS